MIKILLPNSLRDTKNLCEMHQLRYIKFIKELGWKDGLYGINQLEFDCFDHENAFYLVHTNEEDKVDALARLTQTYHPNLLFDIFGQNINDISSTERSCDTIEISRFCSDKDAPRDVMGQIIAGLLEIGFAYDIKQYVSFSNTFIKPRATRLGWLAEEIGPVIQIGSEKAVALKHQVNTESYYKVLRNISVEGPLLTQQEIERCPINCLKMAL